jgi:aarF domain-containing kinase
MAGKRILDVAYLFNASRSVARNHVALRANQLDVYTKTSTLAKAVKNQTDRVTQTAKAAAAITRKLDESPSASGHQGGTAGTTVPAREDKEDLEQDHIYNASEKDTVVDAVPQGDLKARQEKTVRYHLPDSTILPNQDRDAFHGPSQTEAQKNSPFQQDDTTAGGERSEPESPAVSDPLPPEKALPNQTPYLEDVNTDVFRSPRVANILRRKAQEKGKSSSLMSEAANGTSEEQRDIVRSRNHNTLDVLQERGQKLPADIAEDTADVGVCRVSLSLMISFCRGC